MRAFALAAAVVLFAVAAAPAHAAAPAGNSTFPNGNFWLVKHTPGSHVRGDADVENMPAGSRPAGASSKPPTAVYLGGTTSDIGPHLAVAAHQLGLTPGIANIQNDFARAGVGDLLGTFGIVVGGLAAGGVAAAGGADAAAGGVGAAAGKAAGQLGGGSTGAASDSVANVLTISGLAAAAATVTPSVAHLLSGAPAVALNAGWFTGARGRVLGAFGVLLLLALMVTLGVAAVSGDGALLLGGLAGVGEAVAIVFTAVALTGMTLVAVDELAAGVAGPGLQDATTMLHGLAVGLLALAATAKGAAMLHLSGIARFTGLGALVLAGGTLIAVVLLWVDLMLRAVGVYLVLLFIPLVAAARAYPRAKAWSTRLLKMLFAIVVSKLVIVLGVAVAGTMVLHGGFGGVWLGLLLLMVVGFSPLMLFSLVGAVEHGFHGRHAVRGAAAAAGPVLIADRARRLVASRRHEMTSELPPPAPGQPPNPGSPGSPVPSAPSPSGPPSPPPSRSGFGADLEAARHGGRRRIDPWVEERRDGQSRPFDRDLAEARERLSRNTQEET